MKYRERKDNQVNVTLEANIIAKMGEMRKAKSVI